MALGYLLMILNGIGQGQLLVRFLVTILATAPKQSGKKRLTVLENMLNRHPKMIRAAPKILVHSILVLKRRISHMKEKKVSRYLMRPRQGRKDILTYVNPNELISSRL